MMSAIDLIVYSVSAATVVFVSYKSYLVGYKHGREEEREAMNDVTIAPPFQPDRTYKVRGKCRWTK